MTGLFIQWFYIDAPKRHVASMRAIVMALFQYFSISLLSSTLFSPWRHDAIDIQRLPLNRWGEAIMNNFTSRLIGLTMRMCVIGAGLVSITVFSVGALLFTFVWYILPFLLVGSVFYGFGLLIGGIHV
ncbi:MAG TPA: hypothetical protein VGE59_03395 [Patescibacteria group bacterium]